MIRIFAPIALVILVSTATSRLALAQAEQPVEFRVLATSRTSTMEKELNDAADAGFRFVAVMGGETAVGGKEVVSVLERRSGQAPRYQYKLLASNRTSTMHKELQEAADAGFEYRDQTVFDSTFGGREVACILERDRENAKPVAYKYVLLATNKTSTLQKELQEAGDQGFEVLGMTVAKTALGGSELVAITRRRVQ